MGRSRYRRGEGVPDTVLEAWLVAVRRWWFMLIPFSLCGPQRTRSPWINQDTTGIELAQATNHPDSSRIHHVPAPKRDVDPADAQRWAQVRAAAARARADTQASAPTDAMGALAWATAFPEDIDRWVDLVTEARRTRFTWREIAAALGEGEDAKDAVAERYAYRRRTRDRKARTRA